MAETPPPEPPDPSQAAPPEPSGDMVYGESPLSRCPICGYSLVGLPVRGTCPECGSTYGPEKLLKPWPSAGTICLQLGWPLLIALFGVTLMADQSGGAIMGMLIVYAMLVVIPVNSYFRVRRMLRDSLPHNIRTRGPIAIMRAIGTVLCVVMFLIFFGLPVACLGFCLIANA